MAVLYTIWGLLNIGLGITLFVISYRNFRFFSERYGSVTTGLLFLMTLSMCQSSGNKRQVGINTNFSTTTVFIPKFSPHWLSPYQTRLVDLGSFQLSQHLMLTRKNQSDSTQITSTVNLTGFTSGFLWTPIVSSANVDVNRRIRYNAVGMLEWRLLGIPLYHQFKQFAGSVSVDSLQTP